MLFNLEFITKYIIKMTEVQERPTKMCRLCLSNTTTFTSILENKVVSNMLLALTSLVVQLFNCNVCF